MAQDSWFFAAYGAGLFYLSLNPGKARGGSYLPEAWVSFILSIFTVPVFTPFKAGVSDRPDSLLSVQVWENGVSRGFLGLSLVFLVMALAPGSAHPSGSAAPGGGGPVAASSTGPAERG